MVCIGKEFFRSSLLILVIVTLKHGAEGKDLIELISKLSERCSIIETIPRQTAGELAINSGFRLKSLKQSLKPLRINRPILDNINELIPELLEGGFAEAENILNKENEVAQRRRRRPKHSRRFHSRGTIPADKIPSACRALGILKTSKRVINALRSKVNITTNEIQQILQQINLPAEIPKGKRKICQEGKKKIKCDESYEYRLCDGTCNNLKNPFWGAAGIPHKRYLPPIYEDGLEEPPTEGLPNPRQLSNALNGISLPKPCDENSFQCIIITQMVKALGQFVDHDLTRTPENIASEPGPYGSSGIELECCEDGTDPTPTFPDCLPIDVKYDPIFPKCKVCLKFVRSLPADIGNMLGQREQMNAITSFIDASNVYGLDSTCQTIRDPLRSFVNGKMRESDQAPTGEGCMASTQSELPFLPETGNLDDLFVAGDTRVNEQPSLTSLHTLFVRYHNLLAMIYKDKYPSADDEEIYQEIRRIVTAVMQHIISNEFLPVVLSPAVAMHYDLLPLQSGYFDGYDPKINPTTANVFATAAYRFGHSLIGEIIKGDETLPLEEGLFRNEKLKTEPLYPSKILHKECTLESKPMDVFIVDAVRNKLFADEAIGFAHGLDLFALNIMRGRDHGIPGYNAWRKFCGLKPFRSFRQLTNIMDRKVAVVFRDHYKSIDDVEIFPAGIAEYPLHEGVVGETFACLIGNQFRELKFGDRFWYDGKAQPKPFTEEQLKAIRGTTLASVLCEGTSIMKIQKYPLLKETLGNFAQNCSTIVEGTVPQLLQDLW